MTPRARRRVRIGIAIGSIPVAVVAIALVVKLLSMYAFAQASIDAHHRGDAAGTVTSAEWLQPFNWFESWKAPYDLGVGLADAGSLERSRAEFERALPLADGIDACPVHINIALVIERMGDRIREAEPERAAQLYAEALAVTAETPEACRGDEAREESPDPSRSPDGILDALEDRLREKQQPPPETAPGEEGEEDPPPEPGGDALDEIERRLQDGQRSRNELEDDRRPGSGSPGEGKPW